MGFFNTYSFPFAQYPAVRIALLFIAGILAGSQGWLKGVWIPSAITLIILLMTSEGLAKNKVSLTASRFSTLSFLLLIPVCGAIRHGQVLKKGLSPIEQLIRVSHWDEVYIDGKVLEITRNQQGKQRLDLHVHSVSLSGISSEQQFKVRVLWEVVREAELGERVQFKGTVIPLSDARNPLSFDYPGYLKRRGIYTQVRADTIISINPLTDGINWLTLRKKALSLIDRNFSSKTAPVAKALLLGYKNELEGETRQAFARSGLSHIMAVSGLHVGLIVAPFWLIIPYFWTKKRGKEAGLILLLLLLTAYAGITGFSASVMRASVMAAFLTYGKLFSRRADSINLTAAAALLILMADPQQLFEIGFQLSFSAVLIILLVLPVIQSKLPYWIRSRWYASPLMIVIVSMVVQLGLYPLQVWYFGEVSLISPIANALFVPLLGIIVPLAMLGLIVSSVLPVTGSLMNLPAEYFLRLMDGFVRWASALEWSWMKAGLESPVFFFFWISGVLTIAGWRNKTLRWKLLSVTLLAFVGVEGHHLYKQLQPQFLEVIILDVGQGDAALIKTPSGKNMLIDAGIWTPGGNSGSQVIIPYMKQAGISSLDAVVLSHPHADHIGGIISILEEIKTGRIYNSGYEYDSGLYRSYLRKAEELGIPVWSVAAGDTIHIDPALLVMVLGPEAGLRGSDPNQHSVVLNIVYGETEFLFTGDAGEGQERRLAENYGSLLDTDFLKVGHHGSRTSSGLFFLEEVSPEIAVVSLAEKNRFGHPHQEAIVRLTATKAQLLFTSRDKGMVFQSNGRTIRRLFWD